MKVFERYGVRPQDGLIGMEVEVEGENLPDELEMYWKVDHDNSLRGNAREYILKKPFNPASVFKAIDMLNKATANSELHFSHRTSVHVHVNVCKMTRNELINFIFIGYFFDKVLSRFGGREIQGNRFALRISDAEEQIFNFKKMVLNHDAFNIPDIARGKYSAVNICPVARYGSVEFRSMRGTLNPVVLKDWVSMLVHLREYSLKFKTIAEMMEGFLQDEIGFVIKVFGKRLAELLINEYTSDDLRFNYSLLLDIMYNVVYDENNEEKPIKKEMVGIFDELEAVLQPPPVQAVRRPAPQANFNINYEGFNAQVRRAALDMAAPNRVRAVEQANGQYVLEPVPVDEFDNPQWRE